MTYQTRDSVSFILYSQILAQCLKYSRNTVNTEMISTFARRTALTLLLGTKCNTQKLDDWLQVTQSIIDGEEKENVALDPQSLFSNQQSIHYKTKCTGRLRPKNT